METKFPRKKIIIVENGNKKVLNNQRDNYPRRNNTLSTQNPGANRREDPEKEREGIIKKLGYRYWNKYFYDYNNKKYTEYPENEIIVIGKIAERKHEFAPESVYAGSTIYTILPICLFPFKIVSKIKLVKKKRFLGRI